MSISIDENQSNQLENLLYWIKKKKVTVAVSLSSGAAEGMSRNIAIMEMLIEQSIPIHEIHGCSAGSSVAIPYATYDVSSGSSHKQENSYSLEEVRDKILKIASLRNVFHFSQKLVKRMVFSLRGKNIKKIGNITGFFSTHKIEMQMKKEIPHTFLEMKKDLYIYAEKASEMDYEVFSKEKYPNLQVVDAVIASIAMPQFFEPKKIYNQYYLDGALLTHTPLYAIYENHQKNKKNKRRPLVIFVSTSIYSIVNDFHDTNFYKRVKNRYLYKTVDYIFQKELEKLLSIKNVYVFLFYPLKKQIYGMSFHKTKLTINIYKERFYLLLEEYLSQLSGFPRKVKFPVQYFKKTD